MTRHVDVDPADQSPIGLAVVLPGRVYSPDRALLDFATQACVQAGWRVRQVWWEPPPLDQIDRQAWVEEQLTVAGVLAEARVLVVAKSLGTWAAALAAEQSYDAVWLTPLLTEPAVVDGIRSNPARQLVVGGTADDFWRPDVASSLASSVETLVIPDADHALHVPGDASRTARAHATVTEGMVRWLGASRP